jgi:tRNA(Ile2) C34 agmatinyltransferase TiaS
MDAVKMYLSDKRCPNCKTMMASDGGTYYCPGCGIEIPRIRHAKKPKKIGHRTMRDNMEELR